MAEQLHSAARMLHPRGMTTTQTVILVVVIVVVIVMGCVIAGLIGLLLPALGKARETAMALKSQTQIREVLATAEVAMMERADTGAAGDGGVAMPLTFQINIDELSTIDPFVRNLLQSPFSRGSGVSQDYWIMPEAVDRGAIDDPSSYVVMYDTAMYGQGSRVAVGFLDLTTAVLDFEEFERLRNSAPNLGRALRGGPNG